jgi:glycosyltransferase involved in cell wall biosynthesis
MENIAESLSSSEYRMGFAYGDSRADSRLKPFLFRVRQQGWCTYHVPMVRNIALRSELQSLTSLVQVLLDFKPDIVHCHSSKAGVLGRIAARLVRPSPRVIYSPHALAIALGRKYLYVEQILKRLTDQFIAVSDSEAAQIVALGLASASKVRVAYPMIDVYQFSPDPQRKRDRLTPEDQTILGVGRLTAQKDPISFVKIVSKLQEIKPNIKGVWVGDGELREDFYKAIAQAHCPEAFALVPWQRDIRPYFDQADVLLSTSVYESFGYMVAEALAMRVPVVATLINGTCDILSGRFSTKMYKAGDHDSAVALLQETLGNVPESEDWADAARRMVQIRFSREALQLSLRRAYQPDERLFHKAAHPLYEVR